MTNYIIRNFENTIKNIDNLKEDNIFHELEIRFGNIEGRFNPNLDESVFKKIYNSFKKDYKIKNEVIIDTSYKNKVNKKYQTDNNQKFIRKSIHSNVFRDYTNDFSLEDFRDDKKIEYILKQKKSQYTKDDLRFTYSEEKTIEVKEKLTDIDNIRLKNRYYVILDKMLRLDMTIVKKLDGVNEYIIELEVINKKNIKKLLKILKDNIKKIKKIYFNKKKFIFNLSPMNPITLEKKYLPLLKNEKYTVTDKADGERIFMIFYEKEIHYYNPKTKETIYVSENTTELEDTIIDGEYVKEINTYLAFDLLLMNYKDKRDRYLTERLKCLQEISDKYFDKIQDTKVMMKKFYTENIFDNAKRIWDNRKTLFNYELDGLIFTPVKQIYTNEISVDIPVLKWKEKLSIDVRVEYNRKMNFTYFHHSSSSFKSKKWGYFPKGLDRYDEYYKKFYNQETGELLEDNINFNRWNTMQNDIINNIGNKNIGNINNNKLFLGIKGFPLLNSKNKQEIGYVYNKYDILEYEFDFELNQWIALRKRTFDKEKPNAYKTIRSVIYSIIDYVSINDLFDLKNKNMENIGVLYDFTRDNKKRKNWRKYNNFVKRKLYEDISLKRNTENNYHLELACGKGGDLFKLKENGYKNILAIDSSYEELYKTKGYEERLIGEGFVKEGFYYIKKDSNDNITMKVMLVWGDVTKNIKNGDSGLDKENKDKLKVFFDDTPQNWKGFDTISIMYAIHYFFGSQDIDPEKKIWKADKKKWESFMYNIRTLLKYNGYVFGTYLNGDNLNEKLMKFIKNGDIMYQINHLLDNKINKNITYDKFFKNNINTIEIKNEVWGDNIVIPEPKINKNVLEISFDKFGLIPLIEDTTFEKYYNDFIKNKNYDLSIDEKKLCFINNTFVFSFINMTKFKEDIKKIINIETYDTKLFVNNLIKKIETGKLDNKISEIYNILIK